MLRKSRLSYDRSVDEDEKEPKIPPSSFLLTPDYEYVKVNITLQIKQSLSFNIHQ
jgi:hypothetical protein